MAIISARVFTDVHHAGQRVDPVSPDKHIDDLSGNLDTKLEADLGWSAGIPTHIRQGWNSRSCSTKLLDVNKISNIQTGFIDSVYSLDENNAYVGNSVGDIYRYKNGSLSLDSLASSITTERIRSIDLIDINNGYAGGDGSLLKLESGVWSDVTVNLPSLTGNIKDISVVDLDNLMVVTDNAEVAIKKAGTWSLLSYSGDAESFRGCSLVDIDNGYISGFDSINNNGKIIKLNNGSLSDDYTLLENIILNSIIVSDMNTGVCVGQEGTVIQLETGAWTEIYTGVSNFLSSVDINNGNIVIAGNGIVLYKRVNETSYRQQITDNYGSVSLYNNFKGFIGGDYFSDTIADNLKSGADNMKRICWFYVNYNDATLEYEPRVYDGSTKNKVIYSKLNKEEQSGTQKYIKFFPFTDANNKPQVVTYNSVDYTGWGIEYQNEDANGYIQNQKIVLIKRFTYPATPDDTLDLYEVGSELVEDMLVLPSVNVLENQHNAIVINRYGDIAYNYLLPNNNGSPDYLASIQREEVVLNQTVKDIVFGQMWCEGGYLGGGGSGTLDGTGLIDNCKLHVE